MESISHEVLIVADDLTGACDAAAPFAPASVAVSNTDFTLCPGVLAVSTESRDADEAEIVRRMRAVAAATGGARLIFKKIDSTLRGNIQAEIAAAMEAFHCASAVITPAFPDMKRIVKNRRLYIDGVLAKDAGEQVLDAVTNQDLDQIVETGLRRGGRVLWAGSAGLAAALARRLYGPPRPIPPPTIQGRLAFCIGSDHPVTVAQTGELTRNCPNALVVPIRRGETTREQIRRSLAGVAALFITGGDTASMVLRALDARIIAIKYEVVTGVPWGMLAGGSFDGCPVVTKSGGFGSPDTLVRVADLFKCR